MSCGDKQVGFSIVNLIVEHNLGCLRRPVDDVDARTHPVFQRMLELEVHLHDGGIAVVLHISLISQVELGTEGLARILKIQRIMAVPHHVHRVHLAEAYVDQFRSFQCHLQVGFL